MNRAAKLTAREIEELLESDDEIPDCFEETPDIPAYLNDNRFAKVDCAEFDELHQGPEEISSQTKLVQLQSFQSKEPVEKISTKFLSSPQEKPKAFVPEPTARTLHNKRIPISKGVMTKRDIFLVKSIEEYATDETLLWFVDFLNYKAKKSHQRSCLVADVIDDKSYVVVQPILDPKMKYYLKLVVN